MSVIEKKQAGKVLNQVNGPSGLTLMILLQRTLLPIMALMNFWLDPRITPKRCGISYRI